MNTYWVASLGLMEYRAAYRLQRLLHSQVLNGALPNLLLLLEHPNVYTLGRRGRQSDILAPQSALDALGVQVAFTDRGGETTYHGPGQLVGYPIIELRGRIGGVRGYVRQLQRTLIRALADFGIRGECAGKPIGVWVGDAKIAAIGVRVSRGVTLHGFALNVCPDLRFFDYIVPCGIPDGRITSMARELGHDDVGVSDAMRAVTQAFGNEFDIMTECVGADALLEAVGAPIPSNRPVKSASWE